MTFSCATCVHFLAGGVNGSALAPGHHERTDGAGLCRRYPPRWAESSHDGEEPGCFCFPTIHEDHICGEWVRRPAVGALR